MLQKDELSFGHLRLSILDLEERSHQPMVYDNYTMVFNGEIYNYRDLKKKVVKQNLSQFFFNWSRDFVSNMLKF
mgnify:CR=1 FL=1